MSIRQKIVSWAVAKVSSPKNKFWLFLMSFAESSFFPVPPDVLLIAILLTPLRVRWFFYSLLTTIASVLGGLFGYLIGFLFFEAVGAWLVAFYGLEEEMLRVGAFFQDNAFFAIFTAAFTPIPYKVFTIAGGLFRIDLVAFIVASAFGRGIRFVAVGYLTARFGERAIGIATRYFNWLSIAAIAAIGALLYVLL